MTDPTPPPSEGTHADRESDGERKPTRHRLPSGFSTIRDILSFVAGLVIIGNEVFIQPTAEPSVIAVGMALTGLPLVFGADERKKGD